MCDRLNGMGRLFAAWTVASLVWLVGCESKPALVAVSGRVLLGERPLPAGSVSYYLDSSGQGRPPIAATGAIAEDGRYELYTSQQRGCPPGKYRVVVFAYERLTAATGGHSRMPKSLISKHYHDVATTTLRVEVAADAPAGRYDLKLQ